MSLLFRISFIAIFLMTFSACNKNPNQTAPSPAPNIAIPVSTLVLSPSTVPIQTETVAQTEGAKEVEIRPRVGGILLKRLYSEGEPIKAGQVMFLIDPVPFQIILQQTKASLSVAKARLEQATREEKRLNGLFSTQSISQREYDNASTDLATAQAALQQAQANVREAELNLSYTSVVAPVTGVTGRFQFSEGALISANTSLLTTIAQINPIWVRFSLSESDLVKLGGYLNESKVKEVNLVLPDGSEYAVKGKLNFSSSQVDPNLGTQELRATFDNPNYQLLPGQFVRARVVTGQRDGVFLLPQPVVLTGEQGKFVFVAEKNEKGEYLASIRPVQESGWYKNQWVVTSGLKEGDLVITDNLIKLRPNAQVSPHQTNSSATNSKPAESQS